MNQFQASLNFYQHAKNQFIPSADFQNTVSFRVLWPYWSHLLLTLPTQTIFDQLLIFLSLYQNATNEFIPSAHSSNKVNFRVPSPDWPFLVILTPKFFNHLLICVNFCQHAKNQLIPFALSWDTVHFEVWKPDWLHPLLTMSNSPKIRSALSFEEFVSTYKKLGCSSICSGEMVYLKKILRSD